ncbi:MAG: cytochrome c, partial [Burkholderiales bacterium]
ILFSLAAISILAANSVLAEGNAEAGKQKTQLCVACHGADGNSATGDFPKLAGQNADYLAAALKQYKSGKRKNQIMAGFATGLSDEDMENLAAYFASQKGLELKY